ncbi:serine hydrolase domain-containing protein [Actinosynnema sp. NPDC059335]|uniref:serine hydrolase domain-containing protein n=1 Tax=Actinosynnema sp. NPDC059335 TaxID=3346804 RepID=UPI00366DB005
MFALSCGGERTIATAGVVAAVGTDPAVRAGPAVRADPAVRAEPAVGAEPAVRAEDLHYELGSVSKTFAGLLVAQLVVAGSVERDTPVRSCLPAPGSGGPEGITLLHLATHTSGLPALPHDPFFYRQGLPRWRTNAYAGYPAERVLRAFGRHRARTPPGSRWRYSNLGMAVLGHALAHRTGTPYPELLARHVLRPLGLDGVRLGPGPPGVDAVGHGTRGRVVPPVDLGGFTAAGAVRATPHDLLTYLEAHLDPERTPLGAALRAVQVDHTAPRPRRAPARALAWFRADTARGPVFFHGGATFGQHAYLGYRPATRTALVAVATRRYTRRHNLIAVAHRVLVEAVG